MESVSQHTLWRYDGLRHRFQVRQQDLRESADQEPRDYALETAAKRIRDLEAQVRLLKDTSTLLLERIQRWQYNAYTRNFTEEQLDTPLSSIDRSGRG